MILMTYKFEVVGQIDWSLSEFYWISDQGGLSMAYSSISSSIINSIPWKKKTLFVPWFISRKSILNEISCVQTCIWTRRRSAVRRILFHFLQSISHTCNFSIIEIYNYVMCTTIPALSILITLLHHIEHSVHGK